MDDGRARTKFLLFGEEGAGTGVVARAFQYLPEAVCYVDLFHPVEEVRRRCHESHFGPSAAPVHRPEWLTKSTNPCRYIRSCLDAKAAASVRGVRLWYGAIQQYDLFDFLEEAGRSGFCLVHVVRNPFNCLVTRLQAAGGRPVYLEPEETAAALRQTLAVRAKLQRLDVPVLTVSYRRLIHDWAGEIRAVSTKLRLSRLPGAPGPRPCRPPWEERVLNLEVLRAQLPPDVAAYLTLTEAEPGRSCVASS